jgi:hypothetical protein
MDYSLVKLDPKLFEIELAITAHLMTRLLTEAKRYHLILFG